MSDPFRSNANPQLIREAQFGLSVVTVLLLVFVYVAYQRIVNPGNRIPEHIRKAAVAKIIREPFAEPPEVDSGLAAQETISPISPIRVDSKTQQRSVAPRKPNTVSNKSLTAVPITNNDLRSEPPAIKRQQPKIKLVSNEFQDQDFAPLSNQSTQTKNDVASDFQPLVAKAPVINASSSVQQQRVSVTPKETGDFAPLVRQTIKPSTANQFAPIEPDPKKEIRPKQPEVAVATPPIKLAAASQFEYTAAESTENHGLEPTMTCPKPMPCDAQETESKSRAASAEDNLQPKPATKNSTIAKSTPRIYVAQQGDSFWSIAQQKYGDGRFFRALYQYNKSTITDFNSISAGTRIETPDAEDLVALWPDLCPKPETFAAPKAEVASVDRVYVTQDGDTLFDIARQQLGQASRFADIYSLNGQQLNNSTTAMSELKSGIRLVLPKQ